MKMVLIISSDEKLHTFCKKLHSEQMYVVCVSPISKEIGAFFCQASAVLLDFELIIKGDNEISKDMFTLLQSSQVIPLVKEQNVGMVMHLFHYTYDDIIALPCCIEYLQAYISHYIQQKEIFLEHTVEHAILSSCIGISDEMLTLKQRLVAVAQNELPVLILGETGTGKSFIARIIHQLSPRSKKKFVEENIAAIQETLIEGELFGTKLGAYTGAISRIGLFEHANEGTLFLDEIACITSSIQTKLLQFLETGVYRPVGSVESLSSNVRLITATNVSLDVLKNKKFLRDDLYYRISGIQLYIPPLRERQKDILPLANYFLDAIMQKTSEKKELSFDAINKLEKHSWPGNIRELERCIESAYYMTSRGNITSSDIAFVF